MAELDWSPSDNAWRSVSVGSDECPGADKCPLGDPCFAEQARRQAAASDVIVVNTHLYGLNVASGGAILPDHDVVVFDEAHVLEDIDERHGRRRDRTGPLRGAVGHRSARSSTTQHWSEAIAEIGEGLRDVLGEHVGKRLSTPLPDAVQDVLSDARLRLGDANEALVAIDTKNEDAKQRRLRAQTMTGRAIAAARRGDRRQGRLRGVRVGFSRLAAPRSRPARRRSGDVGGRVVSSHRDLDERHHSLVSLAARVGMESDGAVVQVADVGSPFDYERQLDALLRYASSQPEQRCVPRRGH